MAWLLNDLVMDLRTPVDILHEFKEQLDHKTNFMALSRLLANSSVVNLCKFLEIVNHYGKEINIFPDELKKAIYTVKQEIENRQMYAYRSQYIAHAFSKNKTSNKAPLEFGDNVNSMKKVFAYDEGDIKECVFKFCDWIYIKDNPNSVINVIRRLVKHVNNMVEGLGSRLAQ